MIFSHYDLNVLSLELTKFISNRKNLFEIIYVVVPNLNFEQTFKNYWLLNHDEILFNVKFMTLNKFLCQKGKKIIGEKVFYLYTIKYLCDNIPKQFKHYLLDGNKINSAKLHELANLITKAFFIYQDKQEQANDYLENMFKEIVFKLNSDGYHNLIDVIDDNSHKNVILFGYDIYSSYQNLLIDKAKINNQLNLRVEKKAKEAHFLKTFSKTKEIEKIYSIIYELIKTKQYRFNDFLITGVNIKEYVPMIKEVFEKYRGKLNIDYDIVFKEEKNSEQLKIINILIEIFNKGFYTKQDVLSILSNEIIKVKYQFDDDIISEISRVINSCNSYRTSSFHDDFNYLINRLVMSKVLNINDKKSIELNNEEYYPYESIGINDVILDKLIIILKSLNYFVRQKMIQIDEFIENIKYFVNDNSSEKIEALVKEVALYNDNLDLVYLLYYIYDNLSFVSSSTNFNSLLIKDYSGSIINRKIVFMINMNLNNLPISQSGNELIEILEDVETQYNRFYLQYLNCDKFYLSYTYYDSVNNCEIPSSIFYNALQEELQADIEKVGFEFKLVCQDINDSTSVVDEVKTENESIITNIKLNDLVSFIEEPLQVKVNYLFGKQYSEKDREEFEPFTISKSLENKIIKESILKSIKGEDINKYINNLIANRFLINYSDEYINNQKERLNNKVNEYLAGIKDKNINIYSANDYHTTINKQPFSIMCNYDYIRYIENDEYCFKDLKIVQKDKFKDIVNLYIIALCDIANNDVKEEVLINLMDYNVVGFYLNSKKAQEILKELISLLNDDNYFFALLEKKKIEDFDTLQLKPFLSHSVWSYFEYKDYLRKDEIGLDEECFSQYQEYIKKIRKLLLFIKEEDD